MTLLASPRPRIASLALAALTLALAACRSGGSADARDDPALAAIHARIPPLPAAELGPAPGFLAGGVLYLGVRPARLQRWLQGLPLGPDIVRDLAQFGNEFGFDPRVDDLTTQFGLDPDAVISATLFRPLGDPAAVRALLDRGITSPPDPFPGITPSDLAPGRIYFETPPPGPPPPSPPPLPYISDPSRFDPAPVKPTADQGDLVRRAGSLGTHARVHLPVKELARTLAPLRRLNDKSRPPELESLCASLGPSELCTGDSRTLLLVRAADSAVLVDFFMFTAGTGAAFDLERATAVKLALGAAASTLPALASLRGDLVAYADADALPALNDVLCVADAVGAQRGSPQDLQRYLARGPALAQLRDTRRLFAGARLELVLEGDLARATFQWEPRDDAARDLLTRLLTRPAAAASVPTIAGLCDGSLACLRTAGFPALAGFDELAAGAYARPEPELSRILDDAGELGGLVLFLETWPNYLGAAQRWPRQQGGRMETAMLGQALEAVGRIEGMGGSLRSLHLNRGAPLGDFIGYMRMQGQDLALIRSLMGLAGLRFAPLDLPQVRGKVETTRLPDLDLPVGLYLVTDPDTVRAGDRDIEVGWAIIADSNDRLTWMSGLERSAAVLPAFYLELPDLWQLLTTADDAGRGLNYAQSWLSGRSVRIAGDLIDGRLRLDFQLARKPSTAPPVAP